MCARRDAARQVQAAAIRLTRACEAKLTDSIRILYDSVLAEAAPGEMDELLRRLK